jgi:hypothetical protein
LFIVIFSCPLVGGGKPEKGWLYELFSYVIALYKAHPLAIE